MDIKVLVIDDDEAITDLMSALLTTNNFDVFTTNSGVEGVKMVEEKNPHIVLLDLMMPDLDGWQVCAAIRKFSNIPIIILSAIHDPSKVASVLDAGADGFFPKPVSSEVLLAHIKKMTKPISIKPTTSAGSPRKTQPILSQSQ